MKDNIKEKNSKKGLISAGEVGTYVVCPESWRLQHIENEKGDLINLENSLKGKKLHEEWSKKFDESFYLLKGAKIALIMIIMAIFLVIFINNIKI